MHSGGHFEKRTCFACQAVSLSTFQTGMSGWSMRSPGFFIHSAQRQKMSDLAFRKSRLLPHAGTIPALPAGSIAAQEAISLSVVA